MTHRLLHSLVLVLCTGAAQAAGFTARVVGVADGDTLPVLDDDRQQQHEGRILVNEAHDPVKGLSFCRPLGGGIEFGETGAQAVTREIREEIGAGVSGVRYVGTLENIFTHLGKPGHEIVQVYDARLDEVALYERGSVRGTESDGQPFVASWRPLGAFGPRLPLFPEGLIELLRSGTCAHAI